MKLALAVAAGFALVVGMLLAVDTPLKQGVLVTCPPCEPCAMSRS